MTPLLASYIVQAAGALFTAILFGVLSRSYRKSYLLHWARAFAALCIMLFAAGLTIALSPVAPPTTWTRLIVSLVTAGAAYASMAWLTFGATELVSADWSNQLAARRNWIFGGAAVLAVVTVALFASDPDPFGPRF